MTQSTLDPQSAIKLARSQLFDAQATLVTAQQTLATGLDYVPPPPPPPPLDVVSWWTPKSGKFTRSVFVRQLPDGRTAAYFPKTANGYPMDIKVADQVGIYDRVTDYPGFWQFPAAYRLYTNTNPSGTPGLMATPRFYDPSQGRIQVASYPAVTTEKHNDCVNFTAGKLGPAETWFSLWKGVDFGGDLGVQDSLVEEFIYTLAPAGYPNKFLTRELFFLTADSGWPMWRLETQQKDGSYQLAIDQKTGQPKVPTIYNKFIPDTLQVPVVPCDYVL